MKFKAWSFSALDSYELCPRKHYREKILRDVGEQKGQQTFAGKDVHKAFEDRLIKGKPLPLDLRHHEPVMAKLEAAPGEGMPEQKLAINAKFQPTGFFDTDVWCRGVADYMKVNGSSAIVFDWKTGKMRPKFDQLDLMTALVFCLLPEVEQITSAFYWTKDKEITRKRYTREDTTGIWESLLPRVNNLKEAFENEHFPPRPNGLCGRYCAVTDCIHHGG